MAEHLVSSLRGSVGKGHPIAGIELVPSGGGVFDVFVDGQRIFSKHESGRHADPGEVLKLVKGMAGE